MRLLQLSQMHWELVPSDTPIHSLAALQPLQKHPLLLKKMKHIFTIHTHTHTQPLGDDGHEKCILLDSWN